MAGDGDFPELSPEALARAEAALAGLADRYMDWAMADSARLCACLDEAMAPGADLAILLPRLFTISHDMKGQAATFGYPLVSELGNRLCRLIETEPSPGQESLGRMERLVRGMAQVIAQRLDGDGGAVGQDLLNEV